MAVLTVSIIVLVLIYRMPRPMDKVMEVAIETYGSQILQGDVQLQDLSLNLVDGSVDISGLYIGNPEGYKSEYAIKADHVSVVLDTQSIMSQPVQIREVEIQRPAIIYELALTGSNIDRLTENAESSLLAGAVLAAEEKSGTGMTFVVEEFSMVDGTISISHSIMKGKAMSLELPGINLLDIGKQQNGVQAEQLAGEIMSAIKNGVGVAIASKSINTINSGVERVKEGAASVMNTAKDAGNKLKSLF